MVRCLFVDPEPSCEVGFSPVKDPRDYGTPGRTMIVEICRQLWYTGNDESAKLSLSTPFCETSMSKQRLCQICKQRPPWQYQNCPPDACKKCYHRHIWVDRPVVRKQRQAQVVSDRFPDLTTADGLSFDDIPASFDEQAQQ